MLTRSLVAVFAVGALTLGLSSPALATSQYKHYKKFYECPMENEELNGCITGEAGPGSYFQAGKVTIPFVHPVGLSIGFIEDEEGNFHVVGARNGKSIAAVAQPAPSLTEVINPATLEEPERARYENYLAAGKSTKVTETIELAVPGNDIFLSEAALIEEKGEGFGFDVLIHIQNPFLGKACYDGSSEHPIDVPFTTGETSPEPPNTPIHGFSGAFNSEAEGEILIIEGQHLVNNEYAAPGVSGCGINGGADAALNTGLGLPSPAGSNTTVLVGNLWQTSVRAARENLKL